MKPLATMAGVSTALPLAALAGVSLALLQILLQPITEAIFKPLAPLALVSTALLQMMEPEKITGGNFKPMAALAGVSLPLPLAALALVSLPVVAYMIFMPLVVELITAHPRQSDGKIILKRYLMHWIKS